MCVVASFETCADMQSQKQKTKSIDTIQNHCCFKRYTGEHLQTLCKKTSRTFD